MGSDKERQLGPKKVSFRLDTHQKGKLLAWAKKRAEELGVPVATIGLSGAIRAVLDGFADGITQDVGYASGYRQGIRAALAEEQAEKGKRLAEKTANAPSLHGAEEGEKT